MSQLLGAAWMSAVAGQLYCDASVMAILAAILAVVSRHAIAGRVRALFNFRHCVFVSLHLTIPRVIGGRSKARYALSDALG